jgi:hypothetical protein
MKKPSTKTPPFADARTIEAIHRRGVSDAESLVQAFRFARDRAFLPWGGFWTSHRRNQAFHDLGLPYPAYELHAFVWRNAVETVLAANGLHLVRLAPKVAA